MFEHSRNKDIHIGILRKILDVPTEGNKHIFIKFYILWMATKFRDAKAMHLIRQYLLREYFTENNILEFYERQGGYDGMMVLQKYKASYIGE